MVINIKKIKLYKLRKIYISCEGVKELGIHKNIDSLYIGNSIIDINYH